MRILQFPDQTGRCRVEVEDESDLFVLYQLLSLNAALTAKTVRKVTHTANTGSVITDRKHVTLTLRITRFAYGDTIAVTGIITHSTNPLVATGHYHTVNIAVRDKVTLQKERWDEIDWIRLKEAADVVSKTKLVIVGVDGGTAKLWYVSDVFVIEKETVDVNLAKKAKAPAKRAQQLETFHRAVFDMVLRWTPWETISGLVVAGNFAERASLLRGLRDVAAQLSRRDVLTELERVVEVPTSRGIDMIVRDTLSNKSLENRLDQCRGYRDMLAVRHFVETMEKSDLRVVFGLTDVLAAHELRAIETLFVTDQYCRQCAVEKRERVCRLLSALRSDHTAIKMVSTKSEAGAEVMRYGGIVATLRFDVVLDSDEVGEFAEDYDSDDIDWFGQNVPQVIGDLVDADE